MKNPPPRRPGLLITLPPCNTIGGETYYGLKARIVYQPDEPRPYTNGRTDPSWYDYPNDWPHDAPGFYWYGFVISAQTDNQRLRDDDRRPWYALTYGFSTHHTISEPTQLDAMKRTLTTIARRLEKLQQQIPDTHPTIGQAIARLMFAAGVEFVILRNETTGQTEPDLSPRDAALALDEYTTDLRAKYRQPAA